jgi:hypothetical protein
MSAIVVWIIILLFLILIVGFVHVMNCHSQRELIPDIDEYKKRLGIEPFVTYPHVTYDRSIIAPTAGYRYPWQGPQIVSQSAGSGSNIGRVYAAAGGSGANMGSAAISRVYSRL